jgi:hypothetical protein
MADRRHPATDDSEPPDDDLIPGAALAFWIKENHPDARPAEKGCSGGVVANRNEGG